MANKKYKLTDGNYWATDGIHDFGQNKTQREINAALVQADSELSGAINSLSTDSIPNRSAVSNSPTTTDALNSLNAQLKKDMTFASWEQGSISGTGAETESTTRIRTGFIDVRNVHRFRCFAASGFMLSASYFNSSKTFISGEDWIVGTNPLGKIVADISGLAYVRFILAYTNSSTITPSAGNNLNCVFYPNAAGATDTLQGQICAYVEEKSTSAHHWVKGECFVYDGILYRVTREIQNGGAIITGSGGNITPMPVAETLLNTTPDSWQLLNVNVTNTLTTQSIVSGRSIDDFSLLIFAAMRGGIVRTSQLLPRTATFANVNTRVSLTEVDSANTQYWYEITRESDTSVKVQCSANATSSKILIYGLGNRVTY